MSTETRLDHVESRLEEVTARLRQLEGDARGRAAADARRRGRWSPTSGTSARRLARPCAGIRSPAPTSRSSSAAGCSPGSAASRSCSARSSSSAMAISNGWIDEPTRIADRRCSDRPSCSVAGVWLHERDGRTEAARAAVASASGRPLRHARRRHPGLRPRLARRSASRPPRWSPPPGSRSPSAGSPRSSPRSASLGALAAPMLVGTGVRGSSIAFVAPRPRRLASAILALAALGMAGARRLRWFPRRSSIAWRSPRGAAPSELWPRHSPSCLVLGALRRRRLRSRAALAREREALPISSWFLLLRQLRRSSSGSATIVFIGAGTETAAVAWLLGFAAVHVAARRLALRLGLHREIGSMLIGLGLALSAFGLADALDGPALVAAWSAEARRPRLPRERLGRRRSRRSRPPSGCWSPRAASSRSAICHDAHRRSAALSALVRRRRRSRLRAGRRSPPAPAPRSPAATSSARLDPRSRRPRRLRRRHLARLSRLDRDRRHARRHPHGGESRAGRPGLALGLLDRDRARGRRLPASSAHWPSVRLGGLALLALAIAKVWTYDLSELDELARVLSFVGLGLLLLVGAFAYQRLRPGREAGARGRRGEAVICGPRPPHLVAPPVPATRRAGLGWRPAGAAAGRAGRVRSSRTPRPDLSDLRFVDARGVEVPWRQAPPRAGGRPLSGDGLAPQVTTERGPRTFVARRPRLRHGPGIDRLAGRRLRTPSLRPRRGGSSGRTTDATSASSPRASLRQFGAARRAPLELSARFRHLRLVIHNGDDPPAARDPRQARSDERAMLVKGGHPGPLTASSTATAAPGLPEYDFARLRSPRAPLARRRRGQLGR